MNRLASFILFSFCATLCCGQGFNPRFFILKKAVKQKGGGGPAETNITSRPMADVIVSVWTTEPLWSKLNDPVGTDDTDYIDSDSTPITTEAFVLTGTDTKDPAASGNHNLRMRTAAIVAGKANCKFDLELRQGYVSEVSQGTLIATVTRTSTDLTTATTEYTLSTVEADSITDYTDLSFRGFCTKSGGGANPTGRFFDVEFEVETPP